MSKVSIGMPAYNAGKYIREAIESILLQTFQDFELIVCDDNSSDNTGEVVRSFNDKRIRYIRNKTNLGPPANFNACIKHASGRYICIFHADDVMLPENLEKKIDILDQYPNVGMVHSACDMIDGEGRLMPGGFAENRKIPLIEKGMDYFTGSLRNPPAHSISVIFRRECYEKTGGFDERFRYSCDSKMWMLISLYYDIAYISSPLVKYRVHGDNDSLSYGFIGRLKDSHESIESVFNERPSDIRNINEQKKIRMVYILNEAVNGAVDIFLHQGYSEFRKTMNYAKSLYKEQITGGTFELVLAKKIMRSFLSKIKKLFVRVLHCLGK